MQVSAMQDEAEMFAGHAGAGRVFVVADDLTGACDSGVAFLAAVRAVRVVLRGEGPGFRTHGREGDREDAQVWAFTTESRDGSAAEAERRVAACVAALGLVRRDELLFKKIDSAGRGHLDVEVLAALRHSGAALALVTPAFPKAGRTVRDGVLRIRDFSGQDAAVVLRDLFVGVDAGEIGVLGVGPEEELEQGIERALASGVRILLCDAMVQDDLELLAAAGWRVGRPLLWCGSAGLARALAGGLEAGHAKAGLPGLRREGETMLFVGTDHAVTNLQVAQLESDAAGRVVHRVAWGTVSEREIMAAFCAQAVGALILTGGETAAFVLRALGATSIVLAGELEAGIPWGVVDGGLADGCVVVTKSGGFGERNALVRAFEFCERRVM